MFVYNLIRRNYNCNFSKNLLQKYKVFNIRENRRFFSDVEIKVKAEVCAQILV